jgi:hypothetical protein
MEIILTENQHTGLQEKIMNSIDSMGLLDTSKIFGGYDKLRKIMMGVQYLTKDVMIEAINNFFEDTGEYYLTLLDLGLEPILLEDTGTELCQIEDLFSNSVEVYCYGGYKYETETHRDTIQLTDLDIIHLYEIIDGVMDYYFNEYLE